jgi:hypothetical protein
MGPGFARGPHALRVETLATCGDGLPNPRPVRLNRPGPGHMARPGA